MKCAIIFPYYAYIITLTCCSKHSDIYSLLGSLLRSLFSAVYQSAFLSCLIMSTSNVINGET